MVDDCTYGEHRTWDVAHSASTEEKGGERVHLLVLINSETTPTPCKLWAPKLSTPRWVEVDHLANEYFSTRLPRLVKATASRGPLSTLLTLYYLHLVSWRSGSYLARPYQIIMVFFLNSWKWDSTIIPQTIPYEFLGMKENSEEN